MLRRIGLIGCVLLLAAAAFAQTQGTTAPPPTAEELAARARVQQERLLADWPNLARYRDQNAQLAPPAAGERRVVFMGDSITDGWGRSSPFFPGKPYVNRGISGQTTPQMLLRFRQDVVALEPAAVVILAGTNDIAGNTGPSTAEMTEDNFMSMVEIAKANHIAVVLASILPASDYPWKPGLAPGPKIAALNTWMKAYAAKNHVVYLDYYSAMVNESLGLSPDLATDGVHPTPAGYAIMAPLAEKAIAEALKKK